VRGGAYHTCVILEETGQVLCWGYNGAGQLGIGSVSNVYNPSTSRTVNLSPDLSAAVQISLGLYYTCALIEDGRIKCWGYNDHGQLGIPGVGFILDPETAPYVQVDASGSKAIDVQVGSAHTCALLMNGQVRCWGWGYYG